MTLRSPRLFSRAFLALSATSLVFAGTTLPFGAVPAGAAQAGVDLGTARSFAVLAASEITNTGPSVIGGDLGVSPGTAITGFPPGIVNGTTHSADRVAAKAQADTTIAYNDAAGRKPFTAVATELAGRTLKPGVFRNTTLGLNGTLTLDAGGNPDAVFIFQAGSTLITGSNSQVLVINNAQACNVFWQVGSSATLGTTTKFVGTILAHTSITANNNATVHGRLLALNGAVTLDDNTVTRSTCSTPPTTTTTTTAPTTTAPATAAPADTSLPTDTGTVESAPVVVASEPTPTPTPTAPATATATAAPALSSPSAPTAGSGGPTTPSDLPSASDGQSVTSVPGLARTGSVLTPLALAGALAILLGAAMVRSTRTVPLSRRS